MLNHPTDRTRVVSFLLVLAGLCALALLVPGTPAGLYMLTPAAAALLMLLVVTRDGRRREAWRSLGFGELRGGIGVLLVSALIPLVVISAGYLALPLLHVASLRPPVGQTWFGVAVTIFSLVPVATLSALTEEIGWRGYLLPKLASLGSIKAGWILGLIWAAWHLPLIVAGAYHAGEALDWTLALFALVVVSFGFLANEVRMRSLSLWPAALLHGAHNAAWHVWRDLPQGGDAGPVNLIAGEKGVVALVLYGLIACALIVLPWTWTARHRKDAPNWLRGADTSTLPGPGPEVTP